MFVPVSGGGGLGEYARCVALARAAKNRWPQARVRFVLDRQTPPIEDDGIETVGLDGSPTFNSPLVVRMLEQDPPDLVVFDNTARLTQLDAATRLGIKRVHIASRPSRRWRALLVRTLSRVDEVWLVEPPTQRRPLSLWERFNVRWADNATVVFLDALFPESEPRRRAELLERLGVGQARYALFAPGGGGWRIDGRPAAEIYSEVACELSSSTELKSVVVTGPLHTGRLDATSGVVAERSLSPEHMVDAMFGAEFVVSGGGSSVIQALAMRKPVVAAPLGGSDQRQRVRQFSAQGLIVPSRPDARHLGAAVLALARDRAQREALRRRVERVDLHNDLDLALRQLETLVDSWN